MKIIFISILLLFPITINAIEVSSKSLIVVDGDSHRVLYEKNAYEKRLIASTTKIMTAIVAIENSNLYDAVTTGEEVLKAYGSNIYISYNESMLLQDLLYGLMLRSGNDAAIVIANYVAGNEEEFVKLMNKKATELGMKDTIFNNPHGLDDETKNYSTAYDMALLASYASKNKIYTKIASTKYYQVETDKKFYSWKNRANIVHSYNKLTSAKTGYTPNAGKVLSTTASNNNLNLSIFSFNYSYDYDIHEELYEYMFNMYKNYKIVDKNRFKVKYQDGLLYALESFTYPLTDNEKDEISMKVILNNKINHEKIGKLYIYLDNELLHEQVVYFRKNKNIFQKAIDLFTKSKK